MEEQMRREVEKKEKKLERQAELRESLSQAEQTAAEVCKSSICLFYTHVVLTKQKKI